MNRINTAATSAPQPRSSQRMAALALAAVLGVALSASPRAVQAEPDAQALVRSADQARGGGLPGLVWEVHLVNTGSTIDEQPDERIRVMATATSSLAEVLDPPNVKGSKMLQVDRNMWMTKPGLKKPVAISPRQRLSGQAAIGDIAATNYAKDYDAKYLRDETINGTPCHVLELTATSRQATYDRIIYWVAAQKGVAVKADFLSLSGKKMKSADFDYDARIIINGRTIPFVSRMQISDALTDAKTTMSYSKIVVKAVPAAEFDVANLR